MGTILVINCGSSSLKFAVIEPEEGIFLAQGLAERLNTGEASLRIRIPGAQGTMKPMAHANHAAALEGILNGIGNETIDGVGHRVVHGGEAFAGSVRIDEAACGKIRMCSELAPLHNPANMIGIEVALKRFPKIPQVAVFDTAFHQTMPSRAFFYAIPYEIYERHKVRRYGFHGTSHGYVAGEAARRLGRPIEELQLVTAHLGNGCSACAVRHGKSADTTMGFTPLEGLVMGTRSGDVDPGLHQFLVEHTGRTLEAVSSMLNRDSGLLGLSGVSNDMRSLIEAISWGNPRAQLAVDVFCYRLAKSVLGLAASLDRLDALVFTGGIGEHAATIRERTLDHLRILAPKLDAGLNEANGADTQGRITAPDSGLLAMVIPTNEELVIARETARFLLTRETAD
jgi:acetate kinase